MKTELPPGARVRCAYRMIIVQGRVPEGMLLALDDPRAWEGSIAFATVGLPSSEAVREHVEQCNARGLFGDGRLPVLWDFPRPGQLPRQIVYWDSQLERVARPTFSIGFTPKETLDCHAREHCGADGVFPMRIVHRDELRALEIAGYPLDGKPAIDCIPDGGGNVVVRADELAELLGRLADVADTYETPAIADAAGSLRSSIIDAIGVEEI